MITINHEYRKETILPPGAGWGRLKSGVWLAGREDAALHRQLRLLAHKLQVILAYNARQSCGSRFNFCSTMTGDDDGAARLQMRSLVEHVVQQRAARQALQHLGRAAFHARALAGRHDEDVYGCHGMMWILV